MSTTTSSGEHGHFAEAQQHGQEATHGHPGVGTYVAIGGLLAVLTGIEIALSYTEQLGLGFLRPVVTPLLLALALLKFVIVVGFYMHLRFDHRLFTYVFGFGLLIAASVVTALIFLFAQYAHPNAVVGTPPPGPLGPLSVPKP